jgi:spermidine/putrescine-binding protein
MDEAHVRELGRRTVEQITRRALLQRMGGTAVSVAAGGGLLAACGGATTTKVTSDTGKVGGKLAFFGINGEDGAAVAKPFLKQHGVTLQAAYVTDLDAELTKLRTGGTRQFDVLTIPKDTAQRAMALGFVRPLEAGRLHNFAGLFPALQSAPWIKQGSQTFGFPLIWGSEPCVYNPAHWKGMPPKYTDFADKKYARALNSLDEPYGNQWLVAKSLGFGQNGECNRLTQPELDKVRDAWKAIKKNIVSWATTYGDQTDLLVRGESTIALNSWQALVSFAKPKGVKLAYGSPADDGTYYWSDSYFITSQSRNPATAYAFIDYMTSAASNAKIANALQSGCTVGKAVGMLPSGSISAGYDYSLVQDKLGGDFPKIIFPPPAAEGDIVGKDAWVKSWQEVKAS